jgi:High potential iron-sulfur protein
MSPPTPVNAARRALIRSLGLAASAAALLQSRAARSAEPPHLGVKDPAAVPLGYVEDAAQVDPKKFPTYVKGSSCGDCLLLQGKEGSAYRPCNLFPGKLVAVKGWCTGWTAEI